MNLILKDKKFAPMFWTQFLGALNDNFFKNALVLLITYKSVAIAGLDAKILVPLSGGFFILPFFLFSATAGQMADKYEKSKLIKLIKFLEIVIMTFASIGLFTNSFPFLLFVLFLMGTQSAFFGPIKYGVIPSLVKGEDLVSANAFVSAGTFIAILIGTIVGGLLVEGSNYALALSVGLILIAAIGTGSSLLLKKIPIPEGSKGLKVDYTFIRPTWDILKLTMKNKVIFTTVLGISWYWFMGAAILSLVPLYVKGVLNGDTQVATLFMAVFTVGMGVGAFLTEKISKKDVEIGLVPIAGLLMSIFLILTGMLSIEFNAFFPLVLGENYGLEIFFEQSYSYKAVLLLFSLAIAGGMFIVPLMAHMQKIAAPHELAQTIAGNNIWNSLLMVVASVLTIVATTIFGIKEAFIFFGVINLLASTYLYSKNSQQCIKMWMRFIGKVLYKIEVKGGEDFPKDVPVIVIANHVSFVDWLIIMAVIPRPVHFIIDWNYYYLPTGPFWFSQAGLVPIATRKESEDVMNKAFERIYEDLDGGHVLGIFPEGWISRDGQLRRFQPGVKKILRKKPVQVVQVAINGLWGSIFSYSEGKVLFKLPKKFRPRINVTISSPLSAESYDAKKAEAWVCERVEHYELRPDKVSEGDKVGV